jgi:hypothetical protein
MLRLAGRQRERARGGGVAACAVACVLLVLLAAGAALAAGRRSTLAPPTEATYRKLCRAIRAKHVRALFTAPVAPIQLGGSSDCAFFPRGSDAFAGGVRVFLRIDDGDQTLWKHRGDHPYGTFRSLAGAGDRAKWGYQGGRRPSVVDARKGTFTCTLIPADGGSGFVGFPGSPVSASRSFAQRALRLCADVFAAYR